jgi:hypothetical protein
MRSCYLFGCLLVSVLLATDARKLNGQEQAPPPGISKNNQGATVLRLPPGMHAKISQQFHKQTENCASAKIDIWIQAGRVEYVIFAPYPGDFGKIESDSKSIRVGKADCRIDVVMEAQ